MADVTLLFARDCPNVGAARKNLRSALERVGAAAVWREIDIDSGEPALRRFGSPTVLVDGVDVASAFAAEGSSCRLYEGNQRAPSIEAIARALAASLRRENGEPR